MSALQSSHQDHQKLAERCSYLEEENRQLRAALRSSDDARFPSKWTLSGGEKRVLMSLVSSVDGFRSYEALLHAGRRYDSVTDPGLVKVLVAKLRKNLRPFGVEIQTVWGQGYKISAESKAIVQAARTREVVA